MSLLGDWASRSHPDAGLVENSHNEQINVEDNYRRTKKKDNLQGKNSLGFQTPHWTSGEK